MVWPYEEVTDDASARFGGRRRSLIGRERRHAPTTVGERGVVVRPALGTRRRGPAVVAVVFDRIAGHPIVLLVFRIRLQSSGPSPATDLARVTDDIPENADTKAQRDEQERADDREVEESGVDHTGRTDRNGR